MIILLFVERVMILIKEHGITKNKLLTDLKLGKNSFVDWEKRGTIPSGETFNKIADYFNVTTDYLLGKTDDPNPQILEVPKALRQVMVAFEGVEELSQKQVEKIAEYTKFVLSQPD